MQLIAIDPGDTYTGVAFFESDEDEEYGWRCIDAQEWIPDDFEDALAETILAGDVDIIVYERFRLYNDKAVEQTGSEFDTAQSIGVFKFIVRNHNRHVAAHAHVEKNGGILTCEQPGGVCHDPDRRPSLKWITLHGQVADIKKPTAGILRRKKIKSVAKPISRGLYHGRDHVVDAELHGWKYILDPPKA